MRKEDFHHTTHIDDKGEGEASNEKCFITHKQQTHTKNQYFYGPNNAN